MSVAVQPSKEFERTFGVSGIAGEYNYSENPGCDLESLQNRIWAYTGMANVGHRLAARLQEFSVNTRRPGITIHEIKSHKSLHEAFSRFAEERDHSDVKSMLAELESRNPRQVAEIEFDRENFQQLVDVVHGIISGLNPSDINFYLRRMEQCQRAETPYGADEADRRALESLILNHVGNAEHKTVGWMASRETLERIWEQVRGRPAVRAVSADERAKFQQSGRGRDK